ncbi:PRC-barrel domain-containing protein [Massilia sp. Se16.2.3]|uniref:PRC-barrel domain-containing protein n=1 Tax=Massilia sp. Se16.2.3 TaxID=2709303 RepID=UPI0016014138|nr:PRC-barrel domain-containing protein [Massilia sp. Se16.2.3]QNB00909.1 PRC-barrel domain containing protein [Massilia sp. Se16.2.3]
MSYADRDKYGMYKGSSSAGPGPALMGADTLIGDHVVNGADERLGDIKEIMLDMNSGQVAYAVLAFGGFLGLGEKLFAVPWQALHLDTVHKRFVLNMDKERLKTAPGFNKDAWPDMSDVGWASQIHTFYGTDPQRSGAPTMGPGSMMGGMGRAGSGMASGMGAGMGGSMGAGHAGSSSGSSYGAGGGMGSAGGGSVGGAGGGVSGTGVSDDSALGTGGGGSIDPRPGNLGDDKDISKIRGSNIG